MYCAAFEEMLRYAGGPYVLDAEAPYVKRVLSIIPSGRAIDDMIIE